jgi:predicted enzyme related to lactoylglutathione lyase
MNAPTVTARAINWFEIPVRDLARAQRFYEALLERPMRRETMGPHEMAMFVCAEGDTGGCLVSGADVPEPSLHGATVYLNAEPSLDAALGRVERAGGRTVLPRTELPAGLGAFALVVDPEGNRIGLHALA